MRTVDCPEATRPAPARTCLDEALARQKRCRERYVKVIGSAYEANAYENLLHATRAVLDCRRAA
jgi:hypothetical protein